MNLTHMVDAVEKILAEPRYHRLKSCWSRFYNLTNVGKKLIKITFTMQFFAHELKFNLVDHYHRPEQYIEDSLNVLAFQHQQIDDDRLLTGIVINFGEAFEPSLFGLQPLFYADRDPAFRHEPIIKHVDDLQKLKHPDFYTSGLMPKILKVYETAEKIVDGRIPIHFERWDRGVIGLAIHLRGFVNLLRDTVRRPRFVHDFMDFLTESRIHWECEREKYLGKRVEAGRIADDEVGTDLISPRVYETFVHPYERRLAEFYPKGISYFHSCGNITPFLNQIAQLPGLQRIQISPVTDFRQAIKVLKNEVVYQKRFMPTDFDQHETHMKNQIQGVMNQTKELNVELDPGPIINNPVNKITRWIKLTRELAGTGTAVTSH